MTKLRSDTPSVSSMSVHGEIITTVSPYRDRIPGNDITQELDNPR